MWQLLGLLAALAAVSNNSSPNSFVQGACRSPESTSRTLSYRARDGSAIFRFRFSALGHSVRIHILEFPNPQAGSCHVLQDNQGPYICWSSAINSMSAAKAVAAMWAEATLVYQRTGRTF